MRFLLGVDAAILVKLAQVAEAGRQIRIIRRARPQKAVQRLLEKRLRFIKLSLNSVGLAQEV